MGGSPPPLLVRKPRPKVIQLGQGLGPRAVHSKALPFPAKAQRWAGVGVLPPCEALEAPGWPMTFLSPHPHPRGPALQGWQGAGPGAAGMFGPGFRGDRATAESHRVFGLRGAGRTGRPHPPISASVQGPDSLLTRVGGGWREECDRPLVSRITKFLLDL